MLVENVLHFLSSLGNVASRRIQDIPQAKHARAPGKVSVLEEPGGSIPERTPSSVLVFSKQILLGFLLGILGRVGELASGGLRAFLDLCLQKKKILRFFFF